MARKNESPQKAAMREQSLEKDIEDAMVGKFTWEDLDTGGK